MGIFNFKKKNVAEHTRVTAVQSISKDELFNPATFNHWFKNDYDGYGGYPGSAKGIFLRTDKLSESMFIDYFAYFKHEYSFDEMYNFKEEVFNNWIKQLNK